jgi:hypothetical protein
MENRWRLYTEDPSALLSLVMNYAQDRELRVVSLNTLGPSLEDVFLEITGQQVGAVHQEPADKNRQRRGKGGQ